MRPLHGLPGTAWKFDPPACCDALYNLLDGLLQNNFA